MRHFAVLTFVLVAALFVATSHGVNSTYGSIGVYDRLLHREFVVENRKFFRVVVKDVQFPPRGYTNQKVITAVRAIDRGWGKNGGGYATLYGGGPGFRNVTLHLQSFRNQNLNFTVEIYGR